MRDEPGPASEWDDVAEVEVGVVLATQPFRLPDTRGTLTFAAGIEPVAAVVVAAVGIAAATNGYRLYRGLSVIALASLAAWGGWVVGGLFDAKPAGSLVAALLTAAVAWPWPRVSVGLCAVLSGTVAGLAAWRAGGGDDAYAWAGGVIGGVFLGMLSVINLRLGAAWAFAYAGVVATAVGVGGLVLRYEAADAWVASALERHPLVLPVGTLGLVLACVLLQGAWSRAEVPAKR